MRALIKNGYVVTMDAARATHERGYVSIDDRGRIGAVGDMSECPRVQADTEVDATGMIVLPGFINAHTHHWHNLVRGIGQRWHGSEPELHSALQERLRTEDLRLAAQLYAAQMIRTGTTCVLNHSVTATTPADVAATIEPMRDVGVRQVFAKEYRSADRASADGIRNLVETHENAGKGLVRIALAIESAPHHLLESNSSEGLIESGYLLARELNLRISTHSSGDEGHADYLGDIRSAGRSHVMHLMELGVLDERWLLVQPNLLDDTDIDLMREAGCHAVYTPVSEAFRGIGPGRWALLSRAVNCALGTDGPLFDAADDMVEQIKACSMIQNAARLNPMAMPFEASLEMATINAARALGLESEIGSLEAGKRADVAVFDLDHPHAQVSHKPISTFIATGRGADAHAVFVDGELLLNEGRPTRDFNTTNLVTEAKRAGRRLVAPLLQHELATFAALQRAV